MKVVICADVHLDGTFLEAGKNSEKLAQRRDEARASFMQVIHTVQKEHAAMLLIAGDLFDSRHVTEDTVSFLKAAFSEIPDTYVFIAPGNNDPATLVSPYRTTPWPENVYIFMGALEAVELAIPETGESVRVYGAGCTGRYQPGSLSDTQQMPELSPAYTNILLFHGTVEPELLDQWGFDFCALGHQHAYSGVVALPHTFYAYPGICVPRDFTAAGGILVGNIGHQYQDLTFMSVASRQYVAQELEITALSNQAEIEAAIQAQCPCDGTVYRITLTGVPRNAASWSLKGLRAQLQATYGDLQIRTRFQADVTAAQPLQTGLLRDYFLKEAQAYTPADAQEAEVLRLATQYGLAALADADVSHDLLEREEFDIHED